MNIQNLDATSWDYATYEKYRLKSIELKSSLPSLNEVDGRRARTMLTLIQRALNKYLAIATARLEQPNKPRGK